MPATKFFRFVLTTLACVFISNTAFAVAPVIVNSTEPAEDLVTAGMTELWRAGGDDDEIFFGTLGAIRTDNKGLIYILDSTLATIHIYTPEGELVRSLNQEGEGPGEVRNPADMFITDDGTICLLQSFPGRIIKITPDGLPAGEATYNSGIKGGGQFAVMMLGRAHGEEMILGGIRMTAGGAISKQTYFLARCDNQGLQKVAIHEKPHEINYAEFRMDEMAMDFIWNRMTMGPGGKVYVGTRRNEYFINVYDTEGNLERTITKDVVPAPRTDRQKKVARQIIDAIAAYYPVPPLEITIESTEPVLGNLMTTDDGHLWVQTNAGNQNTPDGAWIVLDVFDTEGKFEKQVALQGEHDPTRDALVLLPDGKVIVVVGALDAWLNQQGAGDSTADTEEGAPLEVICYRLEW